MREEYGDIWTKHGAGHWVAVTTNGSLNRFGLAVLGRGSAKEAVFWHPDLPRRLGAALEAARETTEPGLPVTPFPDLLLIAFPVKAEWYQPASERLIVASCGKLMALMEALEISKIYLVRPGCGNGRLDWKDVKPLIAPLLDDRVIIIDKKRS